MLNSNWVFFYKKRGPSKKYSAESKQEIVETMQRKKLNYVETAERFQQRHKRVQDWERIYLTYGADEFRVERRGHDSKCHPPKLEKQVEEDLIEGVQRLRAEGAYLKNLQVLVLKDERKVREKHW